MTGDACTYIACKDDDGRRVDRVLRRILRDAPLSSVYKAIRQGDVRINGKRIKGSGRINEGDRIEVRGREHKESENREQRIERIGDSVQRTGNAEQRESGQGEEADSAKCPAPPCPLGMLDILFQNEHILAVNKPVGVATHGKGSMAEAVARLRQDGMSASLSWRPGPLHRLDRMTSGVLVFSQSLMGAVWWSKQLQLHNIHKTYFAILEGEVLDEQHWIDRLENKTGKTDGKQHSSKRDKGGWPAGVKHEMFHTVFCRPSETPQQDCRAASAPLSLVLNYAERNPPPDYTEQNSSAVRSAGDGDTRGKEAVTAIYPIAHNKKATFARIVIYTGRKHQIRCQCAAHGHPLAGDTAYGASPSGHKAGGAGTIFLHAAKVEIPANELGIPPTLVAPLPHAFSSALDIYLPDWKEYSIM